MAQNLKDLAGRLPSGPRGMGTALKLLLGAGAVAYGIRESVFTGEQPAPALRTPANLPWTPSQPHRGPALTQPLTPPHQKLARTLSPAWTDPHPSPCSGRRAQSHFL